MKQHILSLCLAILLIPTLANADKFSSMGTRWPSGLKKTLTGNDTYLFSANGDTLAAYDKTNMTPLDQINLNAPEGIIAIDYMKVDDDVFIVAACGTGGIQVIPFASDEFSTGESIIVEKQSDTARANETPPAALDIKGCVSFRFQNEQLIATMDDSFGYRVYQFNASQTPKTLSEVARQELSDEKFTMLVDMARWTKALGHDCILTISKGRELGLLDMKLSINGEWEIIGVDSKSIELPDLPSTQLLYFSSLTVTVSGNTAHVVENSQGNFFSFALSTSAPHIKQTYPAGDIEGVALGFPLDLVANSNYACVTTLMEKDGALPGVQVMHPDTKGITGTFEQAGAGSLHMSGTDLFLMDLKTGLSKISISDQANPTRMEGPLATPFAAYELLARETYLFMTDGLQNAQGGFRVIDISNAAKPKLVHFGATPGTAGDISVDGDFYRLFIADGDQGVRCYSMNSTFITEDYDDSTAPPSPEAPLFLETLSCDLFEGEEALKVTVTTKNIGGENIDFLHVLTAGGKLFSFPLPQALANPSFPEVDTDLKSSFSGIPGTPMAMEPLLNDYLLIAAGPQGLQVVDLFSDTNNPEVLSPAIEAAHTEGLSHTVSVSSDGSRYACIADNSGGIVAFDLFSDPNTPAVVKVTRLGGYNPGGLRFLDLFLTDNNNCYVITDQAQSNIQILDLSKPDAISHLSSETTLGSPMAILAATTGGLSPDTPSLRAAYVADGQGGLAIRQTTSDDNVQEQTWEESSSSCFIRATGHPETKQ